MLFYDSFCIYPCNFYVQFREKIKLSVSVSDNTNYPVFSQIQSLLLNQYQQLFLIDITQPIVLYYSIIIIIVSMVHVPPSNREHVEADK